MKLALKLPIPVSTNALHKSIWVHGKMRRAKTEEARQYEDMVILNLRAQYGPVKLKPPIRIDGTLYGPDWRGLDIDNTKGLKDALAKAVGVNDRYLVHD